MDASVVMPGTALSDLERKAGTAAVASAMDEESFRAFYDRTARPVWAYLSRLTGEPRLADDLLQEAYYRFFRAGVVFEDEAHRRNYLYRIATNLVRDRARRESGTTHVPLDDGAPPGERHAEGAEAAFEMRADLARAMARLTARQREMLWLAYAEGFSHEEVARAVGVKAANVRTLLFRARQRLAGLLRGATRTSATGGRRG